MGQNSPKLRSPGLEQWRETARAGGIGFADSSNGERQGRRPIDQGDAQPEPPPGEGQARLGPLRGELLGMGGWKEQNMAGRERLRGTLQPRREQSSLCH